MAVNYNKRKVFSLLLLSANSVTATESFLSQRSSFVSFMQQVCSCTLCVWLLLLPPTSHGQLTLSPPMFNKLSSFVYEATFPWQRSWINPNGQAGLAKVHNSFTITLEHSTSVLRMRHNEETQSDVLYFWLLSGHQYDDQSESCFYNLI